MSGMPEIRIDEFEVKLAQLAPDVLKRIMGTDDWAGAIKRLHHVADRLADDTLTADAKLYHLLCAAAWCKILAEDHSLCTRHFC